MAERPLDVDDVDVCLRVTMPTLVSDGGTSLDRSLAAFRLDDTLDRVDEAEDVSAALAPRLVVFVMVL